MHLASMFINIQYDIRKFMNGKYLAIFKAITALSDEIVQSFQVNYCTSNCIMINGNYEINSNKRMIEI